MNRHYSASTLLRLPPELRLRARRSAPVDQPQRHQDRVDDATEHTSETTTRKANPVRAAGPVVSTSTYGPLTSQNSQFSSMNDNSDLWDHTRLIWAFLRVCIEQVYVERARCCRVRSTGSCSRITDRARQGVRGECVRGGGNKAAQKKKAVGEV